MKVFQIVFDVPGVDNEISREINYWTAPSLFAATATASAHAYEYEKQLVAVQETLVITRQIEFQEGQELLERSINYGLLEGEGITND